MKMEVIQELQIDKEKHLIKAFAQHGITISLADIQEVLRLGVDTYLLRMGVIIPDKELLEFYLILNEMR